MAGVGPADLGALSCRELVWRFDGVVYQRWQEVGATIAGVYNSQGGKRGGGVWNWWEFHPAHMSPAVAKSGRQVVSDSAVYFAADVEWLPGYGPGGVMPGQNAGGGGGHE